MARCATLRRKVATHSDGLGAAPAAMDPFVCVFDPLGRAVDRVERAIDRFGRSVQQWGDRCIRPEVSLSNSDGLELCSNARLLGANVRPRDSGLPATRSDAAFSDAAVWCNPSAVSFNCRVLRCNDTEGRCKRSAVPFTDSEGSIGRADRSFTDSAFRCNRSARSFNRRVLRCSDAALAFDDAAGSFSDSALR